MCQNLDLGRAGRVHQHHQLALEQRIKYHQRIGEGERICIQFWRVTVLSNMYFEAEACKVAMHKGESFDQGSTCGEGEGAIVDIEELVDLIGGEFAQRVHAWGVALRITSVKFVVWSVGHGQYFDACLFPCRFKHFSCH